MMEELTFVIGCILVFVLAFCGILMGIVHIEFPGEQVRIEQLRSDITRVSGNLGEDVMGQVTEVNQKIAAKKRYNSISFLCLFIPNGWDGIDMIEVR